MATRRQHTTTPTLRARPCTRSPRTPHPRLLPTRACRAPRTMTCIRTRGVAAARSGSPGLARERARAGAVLLGGSSAAWPWRPSRKRRSVLLPSTRCRRHRTQAPAATRCQDCYRRRACRPLAKRIGVPVLTCQRERMPTAERYSTRELPGPSCCRGLGSTLLSLSRALLVQGW